jgi:hypothetical protein
LIETWGEEVEEFTLRAHPRVPSGVLHGKWWIVLSLSFGFVFGKNESILTWILVVLLTYFVIWINHLFYAWKWWGFHYSALN